MLDGQLPGHIEPDNCIDELLCPMLAMNECGADTPAVAAEQVDGG